jgi:hypothetical protein
VIRMDKTFRQRNPAEGDGAALSAAGATQGQYLPLAEESNTTAAAIGRANAYWKELEARRRSTGQQMDEAEPGRQDAA